MSLYDIDTEEETMYIIRAQNKKIQNLYNEMESKESALQKLRSECSKIKQIEDELENYRRQNFTLNEKMKVLHNSLEAHHRESNDQLRVSHENENRLKFQLESKDKIISDYDDTIKKYEIQINMLKKELSEKSLNVTQLKNENEDLKNSLKNYTLKFSLYEDEIKNLKNEKEEMGNTYSQVKFNFDNKAKELVELIKQQNLELNNISSKLLKLESDNNALKNTNSRFKNQIEDLIFENNELNSEIKNLKHLEEHVKEKEKNLFRLNQDLEIEKNKNSELKFNLEKMNQKNSEMLEKIHDLEKLKDHLRRKNEEINNLNNELESLREFLKSKDNFIKDLEIDITNYVNYINENIHTSLKWADTYLGVYIDSSHTSGIPPFMSYEITQNSQNSQTNQNTKEYPHDTSYSKSSNKFFNGRVKFNLDQFSQTLINIQKRLNKDINQYEETIYELRNENSGLSQRIESLLNENSHLKEDRIISTENQSNIKEDLHKYKCDVEYYRNLYDIADKKKKELEQTYNNYFDGLISQCKYTYENFKSNPKISEKVDFNVDHSPFENLVRNYCKIIIKIFFNFRKMYLKITLITIWNC
jgi:chromosome segregation ATPase